MRVITGSAKGTTLKTPEGSETRPTGERVKEGVFSAIQYDLPTATVLDLFAGTGQMGIEALSRGASAAVFVDASKVAVNLVRENLCRTKLQDRATVIQSDFMAYLHHCRQTFSLIILDPPFAEKYLEESLQKISEIDILAKDGIIVTERPAGKLLDCEVPGFSRSRDYKYGKTIITFFRRAL